MEAGSPTIIHNSEGARTTPSVVAYSKTGEPLVAQIAKRQAVTNPDDTFYSEKRFVGRQADEVATELTEVSYTASSRSWLGMAWHGIPAILAELEEHRKDMQAQLDALEAWEEPEPGPMDAPEPARAQMPAPGISVPVPGPQAELETGPRAWGAPSAGFLESLRQRQGRHSARRPTRAGRPALIV